MDTPEEGSALQSRLEISLPLLSDPKGAAAQAFAVWDAKTEIALAATFIVAPGGEILFRYVGADKGDRPSTAELLAILEPESPASL